MNCLAIQQYTIYGRNVGKEIHRKKAMGKISHRKNPIYLLKIVVLTVVNYNIKYLIMAII